MFGPFSLFLVLLHVTAAMGFLFSSPCSDNNCKDCASSSFISSCRWCKRDNECHVPGAIFTNPCKTAENIVKKSHCADELSHYDPELSMRMLYLSAVAYDQSDDPQHPQKCLDNSLKSDNFEMKLMVTKDCDIVKNSDCSGYVAISHTLKAIVVAFRGSKNTDQVLAGFLETLVAPKTLFLNGEVQSYWKRGFDVLWPSMETEVKVLVSQNPSYQIWVTGHSLGGALASLASTWLSYNKVAPRKNIILYTFGMPRVGDYDYALQHDQLVNNSWRVVNDDDLVPHFPSLLSVSIFNGPYHHGVEAFYSEEATSVYSSHRECHGKPYNEDITCSFSELTRSIDKHRTYFSIPVGTFWETDCVPPSRKKREASTGDIE